MGSPLPCWGLSDSDRLTSTRTALEERMILLHKSMHPFWRPLFKSVQGAFNVEGMSSKTWRCFPAQALYCCNIREWKDMSTLFHGISISRPCLGFLSTVEYIRHLRCRKACDLPEINEAREHAKEIEIEAAE